MMLLVLALIPLSVMANMAFYEYRVFKKLSNKDILQAYVNLQFFRRYR